MTTTRRSWWAPPVDHLSASLVREGMPRTLFGFVRRVSAWSQTWAGCLAVAIFILNTAPLEMQRRILNAAVVDGDVGRVVMLAVVYAGIVLCEGLVKLLMNVYRGWIGEKAVRVLRLAASALVDSMPQRDNAGIQGTAGHSLAIPTRREFVARCSNARVRSRASHGRTLDPSSEFRT